MIKQNKTVFGIIVVVLVLFVVFGMREPTASSDLLDGGAYTTNATDQDLVRGLLDMRSIRLDSSIFENSAFATLRDDGLEIQQEPVGKYNPFEELPVAGVGTEKGTANEGEVTN